MKKAAPTCSSLVAAILGGSWRLHAPHYPDLSERDLEKITPLLYGSGAAALGWWRVRETELAATASAEVLHQAYRLLALQSKIHEENINRVFGLLRGSAIEPILVKGWVAASLYPERGLRPYGDLDLCVPPEQFRKAGELLASPEVKDCWVDLHRRPSELDDRSIDQLYARSRLVSLGERQIRVPSFEDHLALLAVHLLKHGAYRPLWLCDIGAAVESLPENFDWDVCLGSNKKRAGWIISALGLSRRLLGARIESNVVKRKAEQLPDWLIESVLQHWENPFAGDRPPMSHPVPMSSYLRRPRGLMKGLLERWPDPIMATISVNGQFNGLPRLPYQIGNCVSRGIHFLRHRPGSMGEREQAF